MSRFVLFICSVLLCSFSSNAQSFRKIEKKGISCRKVSRPDSLALSDSQNDRLTVCAGKSDDHIVISYFHKNEYFGTGKALYFGDGSYSVNVYATDGVNPLVSYDSDYFPNDSLIALCNRYGIKDLDFFFYK